MYETVDGGGHFVAVEVGARQRLGLLHVVELVVLLFAQVVKDVLLVQLRYIENCDEVALLRVQRNGARLLRRLRGARAVGLGFHVQGLELAVDVVDALRVRVSVDQLGQRARLYPAEVLTLALRQQLVACFKSITYHFHVVLRQSRVQRRFHVLEFRVLRDFRLHKLDN